MRKLAKVGPWGGDGGEARDVEATPSRLLSMEIRSGDTIDAISFSYIGNDGHKHDEGPWGGSGGKLHKIIIGPLDYVKEISGTTGTYSILASIVRSLKIVTSRGTFGPYGKEASQGTPFSIPVHDNGHIIGFFGRSGSFLDAVGVYVRQWKQGRYIAVYGPRRPTLIPLNL